MREEESEEVGKEWREKSEKRHLVSTSIYLFIDKRVADVNY